MVNEHRALEMLFEHSNALWRYETRHEALLLLQSLYAKAENLRETLCERIVSGPPIGLLGETITQEQIDGYIFEILSFLKFNNLPLSSVGQVRLSEISEAHPKWEPLAMEGMSQWIGEGRGKKSDTNIQGVSALTPEQVVDRLGSDLMDAGHMSARSTGEPIGVRIAQDPEWGLRTLALLLSSIERVQADALNPILWGIRASLNDKSSKLDEKYTLALLEALGALVNKHPLPKAWASLPSLLGDLVEKVSLDPTHWDPFAQQLRDLFVDFDYEKPEDTKPVEWLNQAINHPYGDLTELYLGLAQRHVSELSNSGLPLELEPRCSRFLTETSKGYGLGSRYGYCLTAQRLAWMETVSPQYAQVMSQWFDWSTNEDRALVAWSGYLWSRTLSRLLVEEFEATYLPTAQRHLQFATQERDGLASHLAAIFWFDPPSFDLLTRVASNVDSEIRLDVLHGWKTHLENAKSETVAHFFEVVVFPYWDWCARQTFFAGTDGDKERCGFWELTAYAESSFPEAAKRAIKLAPTRVESYHYLIHELATESLLRYPVELTELLTVLAAILEEPYWEEDEWRKVWAALEDKNPPNLDKLRNALARRGFSFVITA